LPLLRAGALLVADVGNWHTWVKDRSNKQATGRFFLFRQSSAATPTPRLEIERSDLGPFMPTFGAKARNVAPALRRPAPIHPFPARFR
jgi:hypothetical protein